jgi:4-amino-4-deoxy-L-arabinose transferase-like glycosyltransferase
LYDAKTGALAGLFLLFSPIFLAQTTYIYLEMPLTALTTMSIYYASREKTWLYVVCATLAACTKAYGGLVVLPVLAYVLIQAPLRRRPLVTLKRLAIHSIPLVFCLVWQLYHKMVQGWAFVRPDAAQYYAGVLLSASSFIDVLRTVFFLFVAQFRWILTLSTLVTAFTFVIREWESVEIEGIQANSPSSFLFKQRLTQVAKHVRPESFLLLFTILVWVVFVSSEYLARYTLPILPLFVLIGVRSLKSVSKARIVPISLLMIFLFWVSWAGIEVAEPLGDMAFRIPAVAELIASWGFDSRYHVMDIVLGKALGAEIDSELWDFLRVHQSASRYIEENYSEATILVTFPQNAELTLPAGGYVTNPLEVVYLANVESCADFDLVYWAFPSSWRGEFLPIVRERCGLELVARFESRDVFAEIYRVVP